MSPPIELSSSRPACTALALAPAMYRPARSRWVPWAPIVTCWFRTLTSGLRVLVWPPACPGCVDGAEADHCPAYLAWGGRVVCLRGGSGLSRVWAGRRPDGAPPGEYTPQPPAPAPVRLPYGQCGWFRG